MRKMMMAAVLGLAACGNVQDPTPGMDMGSGGSGGDGSGSGAGSGDMDAGVPTGCTSAADCGANQACDLMTHACVTGVLTIDPSADYVIDGTRWWTSVTDPIVHGTWAGVNGSMVQAIVGSNAGVTATLDGNTWTAKLPAGSINGDAWVRVVMTDGSGGHVEANQLFALDSSAPQITLATSKVRDERGDAIDFSTGEPVHTHAGPEIDLASGACPSIYKYAYLMDATAPTYGSSTSPNALKWNFTIADTKLDPTSELFRIRNEASTTLVNWTAVPAADAAGVHHLTLTRNGGAYPVAALGSTQKLYIDVKARDWNGLETTVSWCFDNHPLGVPVEVKPFEQDELFAMSFAADSPFSKLVNWDAQQTGIVGQRIVQYAAEPVTIKWSATTGAIQFTTTSFSDYVAVIGDFNPVSCPSGTTDVRCKVVADPAHASPDLQTSTGSVAPVYTAVLRDEVTHQIVATSTGTQITFQLPARTSTEGPHTYRAILMTGQLTALRPPEAFWATTVGEYSLLGLGFTGFVPYAMGAATCSGLVTSGSGTYCYYSKQNFRLSALDHVRIDFPAFGSSLQLGTNAQGLQPASYVPASAQLSGVLTWDSGDDDLPGPR